MDGKNNRIALPNAVGVETTYIAGPLATPSNIVIQSPGQVKMLTRERVRQIEAKSIRKLQQPPVMKRLQGLLD